MSNETALALPDPEGVNRIVTEMADGTTVLLEHLHTLLGDNESAKEMVVIVHENVQALAGQAIHLTALTAGLVEAFETTRAQLKEALQQRDQAIDEADEAYANARDELREDRQLRQAIEAEVARDMIIESREEDWRQGYECGHLHASQDKDAELTYLYAELDRLKYLLELAGVAIKDSV